MYPSEDTCPVPSQAAKINLFARIYIINSYIYIIIYLFDVEYKQISKKNFYIASKPGLYPRRHVHCFNRKRAFRQVTVYNGAILLFVDIGSLKTN